MKKNKIGMVVTGSLYLALVAALAVLYWVYIGLPEAAYMFLVSAGVFGVLSLFQFLARGSKAAFGILSVLKHAAGLTVIALGVAGYFINWNFMPVYFIFKEFLMTALLFAAAIVVPALAVAEAKAAYCNCTLKLKLKWWQFVSPVLLAGACGYALIVGSTFKYIWPVLAAFAFILTYICQLTLGAGGGGQKAMSVIKCLLGAGGGGLTIWFSLSALLAGTEILVSKIIIMSVAGVAALFGIVELILELKQLSKAASKETPVAAGNTSANVPDAESIPSE